MKNLVRTAFAAILILTLFAAPGFAAGHVEGAVNIPVHDLAKHIDQLPDDPSTLIVVYCRSGVRSMFATSALLVLGYDKVYNMPGGFMAWQDAGYPIEK